MSKYTIKYRIICNLHVAVNYDVLLCCLRHKLLPRWDVSTLQEELAAAEATTEDFAVAPALASAVASAVRAGYMQGLRRRLDLPAQARAE